MLNSKTNKQAGIIAGADELTEDAAAEIMSEEREFNAAAERFYRKKLKAGVPKELARTHIGVSRYSCMRASANLRNWLAFLTLRSTAKNPAAQWEIRQFADALHDLLVPCFPRTLALFDGQQDEPVSLPRVRLIFIVNGEDVPIDIDRAATLNEARAAALNMSRNTGRPITDWEMYTVGGERVIDLEQPCSFNPGTKFFLSPRIGVGA